VETTEQEWSYVDRGGLDRRRMSPRLAGDILWLGVTASVSVVIVGIICWSLVAGLSPSVASGRPTDAVVTPETASAVVAASATLAVNSIPTPGPPSTIADTSTGGVPAALIAARPKPADAKSSLRDPLAVRLPNPPPSDSGALLSVPDASQPAQSATVPPAAHAIGRHRPLQHHRHPRAAAR